LTFTDILLSDRLCVNFWKIIGMRRKNCCSRALSCRLVIAPKAPLNRLHVHAHVHRRVSRKLDINQNDQSGTALSKTICISYEP